MEIVNSEYIKFYRFDLFHEIVKADFETNKRTKKFFENVVKSVLQYDREQKGNLVDIIYIKIDSLKDYGIINLSNVPISRQCLLNAMLYAVYSGDIVKLQVLSVLMEMEEIMPNQLGDMLSYVLEHSMDFNERMDGECERYIYFVKTKRIEKGYIYSDGKDIKVRKRR